MLLVLGHRVVNNTILSSPSSSEEEDKDIPLLFKLNWKFKEDKSDNEVNQTLAEFLKPEIQLKEGEIPSRDMKPACNIFQIPTKNKATTNMLLNELIEEKKEVHDGFTFFQHQTQRLMSKQENICANTIWQIKINVHKVKQSNE